MKNENRAEQMAQILEEQAASGLSKKAFCAERGIHPAKFYYWQRQLRAQEESSAQGAGFTQLAVSAPAELEVRLSSGSWVSVRARCVGSLTLLLKAAAQSDA